MDKEKLIKYLINNRANAYNGKQFLLSSNRDPNIKSIDELIKELKTENLINNAIWLNYWYWPSRNWK